MIFCLLFGVIGFIDDFAKVAKKQNEGLKPMQKIVLQVVAAVLWLAAMYWLGDRDTHIDLGFVRFNISWFYYPLMVLVILYLTNAVNLTDGVDGLPGSPCTPCLPCGPVSPCGPVGPCGPTEPVGPCGPCGPVGPCGPCSVPTDTHALLSTSHKYTTLLSAVPTA